MVIRRVVGNSMSPTLKPGRVVIVYKKPIRINDVVVAKVNSIEVIKRVKSLSPKINLVGDNINSAHYDDINESDIVGVVIWPKLNH